MQRYRSALVALSALTVAACSAGGGSDTAAAELKSRSGTQVTGTASFVEKDGKVDIIVNAKALPAGKHGVYIQQNGDCTGSNAAAVGKRFTPGGDERGGVVGDLDAGEKGNASLIVSLEKATVLPGDDSIMGRSIVISADPDNPQLKQTFGIIACGVIGLPES